jgi:hypothetical protein
MNKCHRCGCHLETGTALETRSEGVYALMCAPCSTNTDEGSRMTTVLVLGAVAVAAAAVGAIVIFRAA